MYLTKKFWWICVSIVLGLVLIAGTTTAIVVTRPPQTEAYRTSSSDETLTDGYIGNLLASGNTINQTTYNSLLSLLGSTTGTAKASVINGGTPIIFKMGEHPTTNEPIYWQVVYKNNSHITIWMTQPYTTSRFNPSSTDSDGHLYNGNYSNSILRDTTLDIFSTLSSSSNYPILNTIISTPSTAASSWQSSQSNAYYGSTRISITNGLGSQTSTTNPHGWSWTSCMSDKFWIPSYYEVHNNTTSSVSNSTTSYTGLWGLNSTMRGFDSNAVIGSSGSTLFCWLRSGYSDVTDGALTVGTSGISNRSLAHYTNGVRPAAHLSLESLENAPKSTPGFELTESRASDEAGGRINPEPNSDGYYTSGTRITIYVYAGDTVGYRFVSLKINGVEVDTQGVVAVPSGATQNSYSFNITENTTYEVDVTDIVYQISSTVSPSGSGTISPSLSSASYSYNDTISFRATANIGYHFVNWTRNGTQLSTSTSYSHTVTATATITANFAANTYTVRYNANAPSGTTATGSTASSSHTYGTSKNLTTNGYSVSGYKFLGWSTTSSGSVEYTNGQSVLNLSSTNGATINLYAVWQVNTFTITATPNNSTYGQVSGGGTYNYGTQVTLTATANEGYYFSHWQDSTGANVSQSPSFQVTVTSSTTYTAIFERITYTLNIYSSNESYGIVSGGGTYDYHQSVTVSASTNTGYTVDYWLVNNTRVPATSNAYTFTITQNTTITVYFKSSLAQARATAGGEVRITGNDIGLNNTSATVTYTALAYNGYYLIGWYLDNTLYSSTANTITLTQSEAQSICVTAVFSTNPNETPNYTFTREETTTISSSIGGEARMVGYGGAYNETVLIATVQDGYRFTGWYIDGALYSNYENMILDTNNYKGKVIEARFELINSGSVNEDVNN